MKNKMLRIKVSEEEFQKIKEKADKKSLNISAYIRMKALGR